MKSSKKSITVIIVLLVLSFSVFVFTGCYGMDVTQVYHAYSDAQASVQDPGEDHAVFAKDYKLLWQILEESYPYLPYLAEQGIDTDSVYERYYSELDTINDTGAFSGLLQRMFSELRNFAHLSFVTPEMYQSYYYIYIQNDDTASDKSSEHYSAVLQDPRLSGIYKAPDNSIQYQDQVELTGYPDVSVHYYSDCKALYLQLPTFDQRVVQRDADIIVGLLDKYPESEHIIFDITGNSGGSDYYWMDNIVSPFGGYYEFRYRNYFRDSDIYDEYYPDFEALYVSDLTESPSWAELMGLDRYIEASMILPEDSEQTTINRDIKRWLLTSNQVYSAADKFACFCKSTGWATLVGTTTAGDGLGTTPVLILLPDSGLLVRFSYFAGENPDGSMNAARGTRPDEICIKGALPLNRCLEMIREDQSESGRSK